MSRNGNSGWVLAAGMLLGVVQLAWCADPDVPAQAGGPVGVLPDPALTHLLDGRWFPEAEDAYRGLIAADPGAVEPRNGLALLYLEAGRNRDAAEVLRDAIRAGIGNARSLSLLADLYDTLGLEEQAGGVREEWVRLEGGTAAARVRVAGYYLRMGIPAQAQRLVEQLRDEPAAGAVLAGLDARILLADERWADAAKAARRLMESDPGAAEARLVLAEALLGAGDAAEALAVLRDTPERGTDSAKVWTLRGVALEALGQAAEAEKVFRTAVERDAAEVRALARLGRLAAADDRRDEAVGWLERALGRAPFDPTLQRALGGLLEQGSGDAAERGRRLLALAERDVTGASPTVREGAASPEATGVQPAATSNSHADAKTPYGVTANGQCRQNPVRSVPVRACPRGTELPS